MKNVLETNKLEVSLYESWGNKKVEWSFKKEYDVKIIVAGAEKLQDTVVIDYKVDGKKVATIKLIFRTVTIEGITFLSTLKIVGGYSYKKYMKQLETEINKFIAENLTLNCYDNSELIERGKGVYIIGKDSYSIRKSVKRLVLDKNIDLSPTFKIFKDHVEIFIFEHNNVLYEKGLKHKLEDFFRSCLYSDIDTLYMIINNDDIYYGIGEKINGGFENAM